MSQSRTMVKDSVRSIRSDGDRGGVGAEGCRWIVDFKETAGSLFPIPHVVGPGQVWAHRPKGQFQKENAVGMGSGGETRRPEYKHSPTPQKPQCVYLPWGARRHRGLRIGTLAEQLI